jgi:hypothetical protein
LELFEARNKKEEWFMNCRERVLCSLNHQEPDKLPHDLGTWCTGIHVSSLHKLKVALGLIRPEEPVKVIEPYQMLGEIDEGLRKALDLDTFHLDSEVNAFGFKNTNWKKWILSDGTPLLVPEKFNTEPDARGDLYQYPEGDTTGSPSMRMPGGGYYFDCVDRQKPILEDSDLSVEDQIEGYGIVSEGTLRFLEKESKRLYEETEYLIVSGGVPGTKLGGAAFVPGPFLKDPKGIRDLEEWYISLITRSEFIKEVFARLTEIGLKNLDLLHQAVGERIQVILVTATDFGSQKGLLISPEIYRNLFKPFHQKINEWIHKNTSWKSFIHSCGSVYDILSDLKEAGFDILNPVQLSAAKMDPKRLKEEFGDHFTFWGGGVDTQKTLPFGTPEEVREEVKRMIEIFSPGGGFVFNAVHNIQPHVPVENMLAMFEVVKERRG